MKTNIKEKLTFLAHYFIINRGVGHTKTMLEGVNNNPTAMVVVNSRSAAKRLGIQNAVTLDDLGAMRGLNIPVVLDNHALFELLSDAAKHIEQLERENTSLLRQIN